MHIQFIGFDNNIDNTIILTVSNALISVFLQLVGGAVQDHLLGICVGHVYFFFTEVYPLMPTSKGVNLFRTPKILKRVLGQLD